MRKNLLATILSLFVVAFAAAQGNIPGLGKKIADVAYADVSPVQKLDIYLPSGGKAPYPVVIWVHGGGWQSGDKAQCRPAQAGLPRGYAVVSVGYRLSGEATFPANIHDVKAAIRWVRGNGAQYGLDPDRLALFGSSAGGHLVALAATSAGDARLEGPEAGDPEISCAVRAVVDWFGPTNLDKMDDYYRQRGINSMRHSKPDSPASRMLGAPVLDAPERAKAADPANYISASTPPFLIMHGKADGTVPYEMSVYLAEKLNAQREGLAVLRLLEGLKHGGPEFFAPEVIGEVYDFLDKYMK